MIFTHIKARRNLFCWLLGYRYSEWEYVKGFKGLKGSGHGKYLIWHEKLHFVPPEMGL
jgi:hypothetical protein